MDLHGSLRDNLQAALKSVVRHRNLTVHLDTREYWDRLLQYAQALPNEENTAFDISELTQKLAQELIERDRRAVVARV